MGESLRYERVGRVATVVHPVREPTDEDWRAYLGFLQQHLPTCDVVFVYSVGGAPSARQRKALADATGRRSVPVAFVTPSRLARAIGMAISWFNPHVQTFAPGALGEALAHLKLDLRESVDVVYAARQAARALEIGRAEVDLVVDVPVQQAV